MQTMLDPMQRGVLAEGMLVNAAGNLGFPQLPLLVLWAVLGPRQFEVRQQEARCAKAADDGVSVLLSFKWSESERPLSGEEEAPAEYKSLREMQEAGKY